MSVTVRVALAILLVSATAAAEPDLAWHAPATCPELAELRARIERRRGAPATCPELAELRARIERRLGSPLDGLVDGVVVDVTRDRRGFVAQIDLRGLTVANDQRTLTAPRCEDLADAVAVIVARVASERRAARPPSPPPRAAPDPDDPVAHAIAIPRRAAPMIARGHAWGSGLRLLGVSGIGGVPEVGLGGELAWHVRRHSAFAEVALAAWAPSGTSIQAGGPARVDIDLQTVGLRGGWGPERLPIRAWLTAEAGTMTGMDLALASPQVGRGRWVAAGAGFGVAWPVARLVRVVGSVEFVAPLQRVRFVLDNGLEVYRSWPVSSRAAFGLEVGWQ